MMRVNAIPDGMTAEEFREAFQQMRDRRDMGGVYRLSVEVEKRIQTLNKIQFNTNLGDFSVAYGREDRQRAHTPEYAVYFKLITRGK